MFALKNLEYLASSAKLDVREFAVGSPMLYLFTHGVPCVYPHIYPSGFPYFSLAFPNVFLFKRPHLYGLGYPGQPSSRVTLDELTWVVVKFKQPFI